MSNPLRGFDPKGTYDVASDDYEEASRAFWEQLSARTVHLASPVAGEFVLDVPCGSGPSVLMAARMVGRGGHVLGIDYASQMLAIAHDKVTAAGLSNVELRTGDMAELDLPSDTFDVVLCVLGLFFVDDMPLFIRSLWNVLRTGGRLAVTVLGDPFFVPMLDVFVDAVHTERSGFEVVEPWRRTEDPNTLRKILEVAGVTDFEIQSKVDVIPIEHGDWWRIVMGTGLRRTVMALNDDESGRVRTSCQRYIDEHSVRQVELASHHVIAVKT